MCQSYHNSNPPVKQKEFAGGIPKIFLSLLLFILSVKSTYALASITVVGKIKYQRIAEAAHFLANYFELAEDVHIIITITPSLPDFVEGQTLFEDYTDLYGIKQANVIISSKLSSGRQISVLAHEMVHVKQFVRRELTKQQDQCFLWKGHTWKNINQIDYLDRPWEQEAIRMQHTLARLYTRAKKVQKRKEVYYTLNTN